MSKKKTHEEFVNQVYSLVGEEYSILEEYKGNRIKIKILHNKCGEIYYSTSSNFIRGRRCPYCQHRSYKKIHEEFINDIKNLFNNEYDVLTTYVNAKYKIKIKHNKCGYEFITLPLNILSGHSCPICKESLGEKKIRSFLRNNKISFTKQFSFQDCRYIKPLFFDFYLDDYNICIEYDGIQHYKAINVFGGIEAFDQNKIRDEIKNKFCVDNNIKLIRIPYFEYKNIDKILKESLGV